MAHKPGEFKAARWTEEEDRQLRIAFSKRLVHPEIKLIVVFRAAALATGRTLGAVRGRACALGLHVDSSVRHLRQEQANEKA